MQNELNSVLCLVIFAFLATSLAITESGIIKNPMESIINALPPSCDNCNNCSTRSACRGSGECSSCASLAQSFAMGNETLIMNITVTSCGFNPNVYYTGLVHQIFSGAGSGIIFEILPQNITNDPCLTTYYVNDLYITVTPYSNYKSAIINDPILGSVECFYIQLNQCDYFKLVSELTPAELQILAQHS